MYLDLVSMIALGIATLYLVGGILRMIIVRGLYHLARWIFWTILAIGKGLLYLFGMTKTTLTMIGTSIRARLTDQLMDAIFDFIGRALAAFCHWILVTLCKKFLDYIVRTLFKDLPNLVRIVLVTICHTILVNFIMKLVQKCRGDYRRQQARGDHCKCVGTPLCRRPLHGYVSHPALPPVNPLPPAVPAPFAPAFPLARRPLHPFPLARPPLHPFPLARPPLHPLPLARRPLHPLHPAPAPLPFAAPAPLPFAPPAPLPIAAPAPVPPAAPMPPAANNNAPYRTRSGRVVRKPERYGY